LKQWITRKARPSGRLLDVQRKIRFCPAEKHSGMTKWFKEIAIMQSSPIVSFLQLIDIPRCAHK